MSDGTTPRPWVVQDVTCDLGAEDDDAPSLWWISGPVYEDEGEGAYWQEADARLIVRAVNAHDFMRDALRDLIETADAEDEDPFNEDAAAAHQIAWRNARVALALAEAD